MAFETTEDTQDDREEKAAIWLALLLGVPLALLLLVLTGKLPGFEGLEIWPRSAVEGDRGAGERGSLKRSNHLEEAGDTGRTKEEASGDAVSGSGVFEATVESGIVSRGQMSGTRTSTLPESGVTVSSGYLSGMRREDVPAMTGGRVEALRRERDQALEAKRALEERMARAPDASDLVELKADVDRLEGEMERVRMEREDLAVRLRALEAEKVDREGSLREVEAKNVAQAEALERLRSRLKAAGDEKAKVEADLAQLREAMDSIPPDTPETQGPERKLEQLQAERDALAKRVAELEGELEAMKPVPGEDSPSEMTPEVVDEALGKELEALARANQALKTELEAARKQMASADGSESAQQLEALRADMDELEAERDRLLGRVSYLERRLKARDGELEGPGEGNGPGRSEGGTLAELTGRSRPLYRALQAAAANGVRFADRDSAMAEQGLGRLLTRLYFGHDESVLSSEAERKLEQALKGLPGEAELLVVGYASLRGSASHNQALSSRRARSVSERIRAMAPDSVRVLGVYFGETAQFSQTNHGKNRVVEVWNSGK